MGDLTEIFVIFRKNSYFDAFLITFCTFLEPSETTKFLRFKNQLNKLNCSVFLLLTIQYKT